MKIKLIITLLLLANIASSQSDVKRMFLHDSTKNVDFTRRYNSTALSFKSPLCCDDDTIYVNVLSDSINVDRFTFNLFAYFPRNINPINSVMILEFTDGSNEILYQIRFPDEDNYVEYYLISNNLKFIISKKVKSITFRGIGTFKVKDKSFFIDFYKSI